MGKAGSQTKELTFSIICLPPTLVNWRKATYKLEKGQADQCGSLRHLGQRAYKLEDEDGHSGLSDQGTDIFQNMLSSNTCSLEKSHLHTGEKSSKCNECGSLHHLGQIAYELEDEYG